MINIHYQSPCPIVPTDYGPSNPIPVRYAEVKIKGAWSSLNIEIDDDPMITISVFTVIDRVGTKPIRITLRELTPNLTYIDFYEPFEFIVHIKDKYADYDLYEHMKEPVLYPMLMTIISSGLEEPDPESILDKVKDFLP